VQVLTSISDPNHITGFELDDIQRQTTAPGETQALSGDPHCLNPGKKTPPR
jgi:hypothetical protein